MPPLNFNFGGLKNNGSFTGLMIDEAIDFTPGRYGSAPLSLPAPSDPFGPPAPAPSESNAPSAPNAPNAAPQTSSSMMQFWDNYKIWIMVILILIVVSFVLWKTLK